MRNRAFSLVEIVCLIGLLSMTLVGLLGLSSRNVNDPEEIIERALAQGLALDALERLTRFRTYWNVPGAGPAGAGADTAMVEREMYSSLDPDPSRLTLFDSVYREQLAALKMSPIPRVEMTPDPAEPGLFRLSVRVSWKNRKGREREVRYARWCYAP